MAQASETLQQNAGCKQAREALEAAIDQAYQQLLELSAAARDLLEAFHERWSLSSSCLSFLKALSTGNGLKPGDSAATTATATGAATNASRLGATANSQSQGASVPPGRMQSSSRTASSGSLPMSSSRLRQLPDANEPAFNAAPKYVRVLFSRHVTSRLRMEWNGMECSPHNPFRFVSFSSIPSLSLSVSLFQFDLKCSRIRTDLGGRASLLNIQSESTQHEWLVCSVACFGLCVAAFCPSLLLLRSSCSCVECNILYSYSDRTVFVCVSSFTISCTPRSHSAPPVSVPICSAARALRRVFVARRICA